LCHRRGIPPENRRFLSEPIEMTSRRTADEIPEILAKLERPWRAGPGNKQPVDVLLATNMISVGVDVPRLGLIVMSGQPKGTSEYIQATSRVGRNFPGLVVTVYTQTKSRDRSHYERFIAYHQSIYKHVEPTSVTPFSPQARDRGLKGVLIALARLKAGVTSPDLITSLRDKVQEEIDFIVDRISNIDPDEKMEALAELEWALDEWEHSLPPDYGRMAGAVNTTTLAYPFGSNPDPIFQTEAWPVMTSMRNVDGTCSAMVLNSYRVSDDETLEEE
jgi:superfamily II DNA or RNA helicase